MKHLLPFLALSTLSAWAQPDVVMAPVEHLYLPAGFDSNDAVEVVVTGNFPNSCYARNDVKVAVKDDIVDIKVTAISHEKNFPAARCPDMVVPFKEVVHVGNLQGGDYKVRVNAGTEYALQDKLNIEEASSNSVDEHIYAAIEYVERKGKNDFVLHGWRYSNCIDIDRVEVKSNNKDTLSIMPVMKQLSTFCPMKMMPTQYPVKLDFNSVKINQPLLHVRTMDGKSVNSVINVEE